MSPWTEIRKTWRFHKELKTAEKVKPQCAECAAFFILNRRLTQEEIDAHHEGWGHETAGH